MDKNTLSNYGWIVIAVLVLSVMIALATPFGEYIKAGVESTTAGLFETSEKALNVIGMSANTPTTPDKKTVSGNILAINDVSDTTHNLKVNLSSDTVTDFSGVTVKKYGKNILDTTQFKGTDDVNKISNKTANMVQWEKKYSPYSGGIKQKVYLPKGHYIISYTAYTSSDGYDGTKMAFTVNKDGTSSYLYNSSGYVHYFTINETGDYWLGVFAPYSAPVGTVCTLENIQLEYTNSINLDDFTRTYVEYMEPQTVTANADGTVNGLTSISPDMTLITDNADVVITCEYLKKKQ